MLGRWVAWFELNLDAVRSSGRVRLTGPHPDAPLEIDHAYLADPAELEACCDGVELVGRLVETPPLADAIEPVSGGVPDRRDRDRLREWVRDRVATSYHPSSTCRMGQAGDRMAVVDQAGRVHGVPGLRVADASVFPASPRANIHATVVAVAEKLADAIREEANA